MMRTSKMMTGIALSAALLTGSFTTSFATAQAAAVKAAPTKSTTTTAQTSANHTGVIIAKIKSISSGKLVVYTSSTQPDIPTGAEGTTVPKAGEAPPSGQAPTPPTASEAAANAGAQPPAMTTFSSSATTLTTTRATTVVSVSHAAGATKATETKKSLASLKAGDVVFITLVSGSNSQISRIELMTAQPAARTTVSSK